MRQLSLILIIAFALSVAAVSVSSAADSDGADDSLSAYLHARRLPLVEARQITDDRGVESVLLYGFVATENGKRDAEDETRDFLDDPDITILNRIKVRPELLTLGRSNADSSTASAPDETGTDEIGNPVPDDLGNAPDQGSAPAATSQPQDYPQQLGSIQDYANQQQEDEYLLSNGSLPGGLPLALVIIGSGAIFPPMAPPTIFGPGYYGGFPPTIYHYPGFPQPPIALNPPPFGFPSPPGPIYYPPGFPAGPTPHFPATGGYPPSFGRTISPVFGGFPGFHGGFSGFHGGGFGGGRR
jgi:hypothetical protein